MGKPIELRVQLIRVGDEFGLDFLDGIPLLDGKPGIRFERQTFKSATSARRYATRHKFPFVENDLSREEKNGERERQARMQHACPYPFGKSGAYKCRANPKRKSRILADLGCSNDERLECAQIYGQRMMQARIGGHSAPREGDDDPAWQNALKASDGA